MQIEAGKANTREGWRDVKVGVFARRERGAPTTAAQRDERDLPAPAVRSVVAAVEGASAFGQRCAAEAERLGLTDPPGLSVLGDGAEWVWNLAQRHFAGCDELLDIRHGRNIWRTGRKRRVARAARRPKPRPGAASSGCCRTVSGGSRSGWGS